MPSTTEIEISGATLEVAFEFKKAIPNTDDSDYYEIERVLCGGQDITNTGMVDAIMDDIIKELDRQRAPAYVREQMDAIDIMAGSFRGIPEILR